MRGVRLGEYGGGRANGTVTIVKVLRVAITRVRESTNPPNIPLVVAVCVGG